MKKVVFALVFFCSLFASQAEAQVSFRPGLKGGLNFSHFTKGDNYYYTYDGEYIDGNTKDFSSKTDFYVTMFGALKLSKYYTLQPEISYTRQGSNYEYTASNGRRVNQKLDISYLSLALANKFTFKKFNIHVGPTIDFVVDNNFDYDSSVDLAFFLGAGYDITKNFAIEARIKKGIVPVLDYSSSNHTNVVFQTGVAYTFDVK